MYDKTLVIEALRDAEDVLMLILDRTGEVETVDDFVLTPQGVDLLDATTIRLMAVGESVRKIEKRTEGTLLTQYPNIEWQKIIGMRNHIAHDYHRVDARVVFDAMKNDVPPLLTTIQKIITYLNNEIQKTN